MDGIERLIWPVQIITDVECSNLLRNKAEFTSLLETALQPYIKSCTDRKKFDWGCVSKLFENNKTKLSKVFLLRIFCSILLKLFVEFECCDITLIRKVVYMYYQIFDRYKHFAICNNCRHTGNPKHYLHEDNWGTAEILENLNKKLPYRFYFDNRKFYSLFTMDAVFEGDFALLKFLIKYGLSYFPTDMQRHCTVILRNLYCKFVISKRDFALSDREIQQCTNDLLQLYLSNNSEEADLRRLIMTIWTINVGLRRRFGDDYYRDYVKCLTLFAETVPENSISLIEVEKFLTFAFNDPVFVSETCSEVKDVFPGIRSFPTPRPLKYLCRCKIRNTIGSKMFDPFTYILSETDIPSSIVDYLLIV